MRIRAMDVRAARIDGLALQLRACTLAARTDSDGRHAWEARGLVPRAGSARRLRAAAEGVVPVALETDEGTFVGTARVSLGAGGAAGPAGETLSLVGVGRLDPWPG